MATRDDLAAALYDAIGGPWMSGAPEWSEFADRLIRAGWRKVDVTTIKAAAWDEGWKAAQYSPFTSPPSGTNPYREPSS